jgi:hypothetical protein
MTAFRLALVVVLLTCSACGDQSSETTTFGSGLTQSGSGDGSSGSDTSTSASDDTTDTEDGSDTADTDDLPPFSCELPPLTPTLDLSSWTHPAAGHLAGQTITLVLQSQNTPKDQAPPLTTELVNRDGARIITEQALVGGAKPVWYISVADLALGENCIEVRNGADVEYAVKIIASDPSPGVPRGNGPWKVTTNHQWRCDEQPTFGNLLQVHVEDELGNPVANATVDLRWTDDTVYPVPPDDAAQSWEEHGQPKTLTTDENGFAELWTPWGQGVRSPIDGKPSYAVYLVSMADGASDFATEITTGIWETDDFGCNYCNTYAVNVYGHWSYTVKFKRDPAATQVCEVGTDHEGQQACSHQHVFHDPARPSCVPVAL